MRFLCALVLFACTAARAAPPDAESMLCATNPAYSLQVMQSVVNAQLARDHDPSLDDAPPDQIARQAVQQGIIDCAKEMQRDPALYRVLSGLAFDERAIGWDAYNTACDDRHQSKGDCVMAEVGASRALKRMVASNNPAGSRALVQACQLVMRGTPPMTDWRECVDAGLATHAAPARAEACKLSVQWHVAKTGAEAGRLLGACLRGG